MILHLLWRSSYRYWATRPWQLVMAILGVAAGVAIMMSVDIIARATMTSAHDAVRILSGEASHRVVGVGRDLDETVFALLRRSGFGSLHLSPVVSGPLTWAHDDKKRTLQLIGRDLIASVREAGSDRADMPTEAWREWLTEAGTAVVSADTAARLNWRTGESMSFQTGARHVELRLLNTFNPPNDLQNNAWHDIVLVDISTAQEVLEKLGTLSSIDIRAGEDDVAVLERLSNVLPPNAHLLSISSQLESGLQLTYAFSINLRAMTLLAMLLGIFLLFNAISYSVVMRMPTFSLLRTVGVTNRQLFRYVLTESIVMTSLGAVLGAVIALTLIDTFSPTITQTINAHFMRVSELSVPIDGYTILMPLVISLLAGVAAGAWPAYQAARVSPRRSGQASEHLLRASRRLTSVAWLGALLLAIGVALFVTRESTLWVSFGALFLLVLGYALLLPRLASITTKAMQRMFCRRNVTADLVNTHLHLYVGQYAVAIVVLTMAFGSAAGLTWMVSSFRTALNEWLNHALRADVYVTFDAHHLTGIKEAQVAEYLPQLRNSTHISGVSIGRRSTAFTSMGPVDLLAIDLPRQGFNGYHLLTGAQEEVWQAFQEGRAVLVSEPLARRLQLNVGDSLPLRAAEAWQDYRIAGIFRDFSSASGYVVMNRSNYRLHWGDDSVTGMGIYLDDQSQANAAAQRIRELFGERYTRVTTAQSLRDVSIDVFNQTFAFTKMMQIAIVAVALLGLYTIVMSHQLERRVEFATLRMVGLTAADIGTIAFFESVFIALFSYVLSWPLGAGIASILVSRINPRAFGWTMELELSIGLWLAGGAIVLLIAATAALYPARIAARVSPHVAMGVE